jgi:hypothetical protein
MRYIRIREDVGGKDRGHFVTSFSLFYPRDYKERPRLGLKSNQLKEEAMTNKYVYEC